MCGGAWANSVYRIEGPLLSASFDGTVVQHATAMATTPPPAASTRTPNPWTPAANELSAECQPEQEHQEARHSSTGWTRRTFPSRCAELLGEEYADARAPANTPIPASERGETSTGAGPSEPEMRRGPKRRRLSQSPPARVGAEDQRQQSRLDFMVPPPTSAGGSAAGEKGRRRLSGSDAAADDSYSSDDEESADDYEDDDDQDFDDDDEEEGGTSDDNGDGDDSDDYVGNRGIVIDGDKGGREGKRDKEDTDLNDSSTPLMYEVGTTTFLSSPDLALSPSSLAMFSSTPQEPNAEKLPCSKDSRQQLL